jgi:hypothetical protein
MTVANTLRQNIVHSNHERPAPVLFGLNWAATVCVAELLFIFCRAGARDGVNIDDIGYWIAGLSPFIVYFLGERIFSWRSTLLLRLWMLSLAIYFLVRCFGLAHFIEYPLNLRLDVGFGRDFATSCVYVGLASLLLCGYSTVSSRKSEIGALAAVLTGFSASFLFSILLFKAY